jgi:hypothetical protein
MASLQQRRLTSDAGLDDIRATVNRLCDLVFGNRGGAMELLGDDGIRRNIRGGAQLASGQPAFTIQSAAGEHSTQKHSTTGAELLGVRDAGVTVPKIVGNVEITGNLDVDGTFNADGAATFMSTMAVTGAATFNGPVTLGDAAADAIQVRGTATFTPLATFTGGLTSTGPGTFNGPVTLGDAAADAVAVLGTMMVTPLATFTGGLVSVGPLTAQGAVTLGDAAADVVTITGTPSFLENVTMAKGLIVDTTTLVVDAVNNRVGVGTATPLVVLDVAGTFRATGATGSPASGAGVELQYNPGTSTGLVRTFDFSAIAYRDLQVIGDSIYLMAQGTTQLRIAPGAIGFFGVAPVGRQTGGSATAAATYTANEQGMLNRIYSALRSYGLLT